MPKYPKLLAGSKWGTDDDMWNPPKGAPDLTDDDWGNAVKEEAGRTLFGSPLYRYYFHDKNFRYGWYLYVRNVGEEWPETNMDSEDDMYSMWSLEWPGHFLPTKDEHVITTLKCCQEAVVVYGDMGCRDPNVLLFKTYCPRR